MRSTYHNPILYLVTMHNLTTFYSIRYFIRYIFKRESERERNCPPSEVNLFKTFVLKIVIKVRASRTMQRVWIVIRNFDFCQDLFQGNEVRRSGRNESISLFDK